MRERHWRNICFALFLVVSSRSRSRLSKCFKLDQMSQNTIFVSVNAKGIHHPFLCMINDDFLHTNMMHMLFFQLFVFVDVSAMISDVVFRMTVAALRRAFCFAEDEDDLINDVRKSFEDFDVFMQKKQWKTDTPFAVRWHRVGLNLCWLFGNEIVAFRMTNYYFRFGKKAIVRIAPIFHEQQKRLPNNDTRRAKRSMCRIWQMIFAPEKKYRIESIVATTCSEVYRKR